MAKVIHYKQNVPNKTPATAIFVEWLRITRQAQLMLDGLNALDPAYMIVPEENGAFSLIRANDKSTKGRWCTTVCKEVLPKRKPAKKS